MPQPLPLLALLTGALAAVASAQSDGPPTAPAPVRGPLIMERGAGLQNVVFPRDEELVYVVSLDLGLLGDPRVGKVTISSQVTPFFKDGLVRVEPDDLHLEQAYVGARAEGRYAVYTLDQTISTRFLPQAWPKLLHKSVQSGTENRQRELTLGVRDGVYDSSYRGDGHCKGCEDRAHFLKPTWIWQDEYHCEGCRRSEHRVWKNSKSKPVPDGTVDMVTGVMLARTVVQQGKSEARFTLLDRDTLWEVSLARGEPSRHRVEAGNFDVVEVVLKTAPPAGDTGRADDFEGLFGLHGNISIWMHPESGVPVEITGTIPAGPLEFSVRIELESYRGTPESFREAVKAQR